MLDFALPLQELMNHTKIVHIISKFGTNIKFSIENIPSFICTGEHNMPGGEVFTSPIVNSINGRVVFNTETLHPILKKKFKNIILGFKNGELIYAHSEVNNDFLLQALKIVPNASKIGEFALGINPFIKKSFNLSAFDEKMLGSFHLSLGDSYPILNERCNTSKTHWDLVQILTPEYGGGEIYFDGVLIQKNGSFISKQLEQLPISRH
jgi:aminopeptidase